MDFYTHFKQKNSQTNASRNYNSWANFHFLESLTLMPCNKQPTSFTPGDRPGNLSQIRLELLLCSFQGGSPWRFGRNIYKQTNLSLKKRIIQHWAGCLFFLLWQFYHQSDLGFGVEKGTWNLFLLIMSLKELKMLSFKRFKNMPSWEVPCPKHTPPKKTCVSNPRKVQHTPRAHPRQCP